MASKIKWEKIKAIGNIKATWKGKVIGINDDYNFSIGEIRQFKKGEFVLPENLFPRKGGTYECQKTKTLLSAKNKCQKWWDNFIFKNQTHQQKK